MDLRGRLAYPHQTEPPTGQESSFLAGNRLIQGQSGTRVESFSATGLEKRLSGLAPSALTWLIALLTGIERLLHAVDAEPGSDAKESCHGRERAITKNGKTSCRM